MIDLNDDGAVDNLITMLFEGSEEDYNLAVSILDNQELAGTPAQVSEFMRRVHQLWWNCVGGRTELIDYIHRHEYDMK